MMDRFGRSLVIGTTALSLVFMTWAVMVYLQFNDFGWKEARKIWETKDSGYRVASKLDKRTAVLHELYRQKERALPAVKPSLDTLAETMEFFPKNHQFFKAEMEKLRTSDEAIAPKQLIRKDGDLVLETPEKPLLGKPAMKTPVGGIEKSTKTVTNERNKILEEVEKMTPEIADLVKKSDEITIQLYGSKDDKGASLDIGLYEVLENETTLQDKIRTEKDDITPRYVDAERRAATFRSRFEGMLRQVTPVNLRKP
ncbi:MAG: hypothetical protein WCL32_01220 [Planctomycetota bacterium]